MIARHPLYIYTDDRVACRQQPKTSIPFPPPTLPGRHPPGGSDPAPCLPPPPHPKPATTTG